MGKEKGGDEGRKEMGLGVGQMLPGLLSHHELGVTGGSLAEERQDVIMSWDPSGCYENRLGAEAGGPVMWLLH